MTLTLTAAAVAIGAAGASVVVGSRAGTAAATGRGVLASGACAAVASLAVAAALAVDRLGAFGLMHFVYLVATVSLPLLGLGVLARSIRDRRSPGFGAVHARSFGVLLLIPGALGIYGTHVEPNRLRVDRIEVALDPARDGDDEVRIAVLADLQTNHVGDHERRAIDEVLAADPDVILLPGDLFQGTAAAFDRELPRLQAELGRLVAPHGVFFVRGDVDHGDFADRALAGTGVQILDGELAEVQVGDRRLVIGGHPLDYRGDAAARTRTEVVAAAGEGAVTILLAHRPDTILGLPAGAPVDLTVAGHTHGGQIVLPGYGPLVTMTDLPRHVARGGLHEVDGNTIYVSAGVGLERAEAPQVRLFSRPSIGILTLRDRSA